MSRLSEDDVDLRDLSDEELALAWDLWFDLAQSTNSADPSHTHGVFQLAQVRDAQDEIGRPSPQDRRPAVRDSVNG